MQSSKVVRHPFSLALLPRMSQDGSTSYHFYLTSSNYVVNSASLSFEYQYSFKKLEISAGPTLGIYVMTFLSPVTCILRLLIKQPALDKILNPDWMVQIIKYKMHLRTQS